MTQVFSVTPAANAGGPTPIAFTTTPPFTQQSDIGNVTVTGPITFSPNPVGALRNATVLATLKANGANIPAFTGIVAHSSDQGYVNTTNVLNTLIMFFDGLRYYYSWSQDVALAPYVGPGALGISGSAGGATVGTVYAATFNVSGGTSPYTFTVATGSLPAGVSLNASTGALSGTPTTAGTSTFTIRVTDSASSPSHADTSSQTVVVAASGGSGVAPVFTAAAALSATPQVGVAVSYTCTITGSPTPAVTQQWTLDGANISGATGGTYTPVSGDATHALRVVVTASNASGTVTSTSAPGTVAAASGSLANVVFDLKGTNVVESGSSPKLYTGASGSNFSTADNVVNTVLGFSGDFEYRFKVLNLGSLHYYLIGVSTNATNDVYGSWLAALAMNQDAGLSNAWTPFAAGTAGTPGGGACTAGTSQGRLKRVGSTITIDASDDGFATTRAVVVLTGQTTARVYMKGSLYSVASMSVTQIGAS